MQPQTIPIARVPLARSLLRLLAMPFVGVGLGGAAVALGMLHSGWGGLALAAIGCAAALLALVLAAMLVTMRVAVDVGSLQLTWLGGSRQYPLAQGPVTRVRVAGDGAVKLRSRLGFVGWMVGRARLRGDEAIEVVRLDATETLILVPIDGGRLGIGAAAESDLVAALSTAARVQQRLDAVAARVQQHPLPQRPVVRAPAPPLGVSSQPLTRTAHAAPAPDEPQLDPRFMTGIERVELEKRLAAQRAAALAAAEAERQAAELAAERATAASAALLTTDSTTGRTRARWRGPSALVLPRARAAVARPAWLSVSRGTLNSAALITLPTILAAPLMALSLGAGRADASDAGRLLVLALLLAGPATSLGAMVARVWWPRLVPLVTTSALLALVLIGRSLVG